MESDQTERGSSGKSVLTVAPQHEVWGGQFVERTEWADRSFGSA